MLIILGAVFGLYLGVCGLLAKTYLQPPRLVSALPPGLKEVSVPTRSGPTPSFATPHLADGHPSEVVFVLAHGYGGIRAGWAVLMRELSTRGYDSIAPSMPGQDASPDSTVGFGVKEGRVLVDTVSWVRSHGGRRVVLLGVSMGGAAAWLASAEDPTIDGVISEGAYALFDEAMRGWFDRKAPGASIYLRPVVWFASLATGLRPSVIRPVDAAEKWRGRPALVIQGEADTLIPMSHAERLAAAAGCEIWRVPLASHAQCAECAGVSYLDRLDRFARALRR